MADNKKDITIEELPEPISDQDMLLHNIIDGTPDISDLEPNSRQEVYLKYIALNGCSGGGGGGEGSVTISQTTGQSTTSVMSQKAVTDNLNNKVDAVEGKGLSTEDFTTEEKEKLSSIPDEIPEVNIVQTTGTSTTDVMSQKAVTENTCFGVGASVTKAYTTAFGDGAMATGSYSQVFGYGATATNSYDSAFGNEAKANGNGFSAAFGSKSVARGIGSSAFGYNSNADLNSKYSVVLGYYSKAIAQPSVVSVGDGSTNANYGTRRIINVKDPVNDQDAATKKYVDDKVSEVSGGGEGSSVTVVQTTGDSETDVMSQKAVTHMYDDKFSITDSGISVGTNELSDVALNCITVGNGISSSGYESITIGNSAKCNRQGNIAIGNTATSTSTDIDDSGLISIGSNSKSSAHSAISIGNNTETTAKNSIALGALSEATEEAVLSIGYKDSVTEFTRRIVNVTDPVNDQDAATKKYVDDKISESGGSDITVVQTTGDSDTDVMSQKAVSQNTCFGYISEIKSKYCSAFGYSSKAIGDTSSAFGNGAQATGNYSLAFGNGAQAAGNYSLAFGNGASSLTTASTAAISFGFMSQTTSNYSVALGNNSVVGVNSNYSVALGSYSKATEPSVVSVGDGSTNANYGTRRIINVGDPVNAQDAVTKNYLDSRRVVLYSNDAGTSDTITLSESNENFERVGIYYFANNRNFQNYTEYYPSLTTDNGAVLQIIYPSHDLNTIYFRCAYLHIDGTTVLFSRNSGMDMTTSGITSSSTLINVYKIVGINKK